MYKCIINVLLIIILIQTSVFADDLQTDDSSEKPENQMIFETIEDGITRMREQNGQFFDAISGLNARSSVVHRLTGVSFDMLTLDNDDFIETMPYVELPFFGERASLVEDYSFYASFRYLTMNEGELELYSLLAGIKGEFTSDKFLDFYSIVGWNLMFGVIYHEINQNDYTYPEINNGWSLFIGSFRFGWELRWDYSLRFPQIGGYALNYLETMFHFSIGNPKSFFVTLRPGFQATWRGSLHENVKSGWESLRAYIRIGFPEFVVIEPYFHVQYGDLFLYEEGSETTGIGFKLYLFYSF